MYINRTVYQGGFMNEIAELQRRVSILERWLACAMAALVAVVVLLFLSQTWPVEAKADPEDLRVKRLAVIDGNGIERVVIAAPVPDPIIDGKRVKREGAASGVIIYDSNGVERGGYLTSDEKSNGAMLTLDGIHTQVFTAYANPDNGATLS